MILWRTRFERGYGPNVKQNNRMNESPLSFQAVTAFYAQSVLKNTKINILGVYLLKWIHVATQVYSVPQIRAMYSSIVTCFWFSSFPPVC